MTTPRYAAVVICHMNMRNLCRIFRKGLWRIFLFNVRMKSIEQNLKIWMTNPAGIVTEVMAATLGPRVIGVCDSPTGLVRRACAAISTS